MTKYFTSFNKVGLPLCRTGTQARSPGSQGRDGKSAGKETEFRKESEGKWTKLKVTEGGV